MRTLGTVCMAVSCLLTLLVQTVSAKAAMFVLVQVVNCLWTCLCGLTSDAWLTNLNGMVVVVVVQLWVRQ